MANAIDLKDRIAVVTGGAQGIGRAIAERFIASGAKLAIWDMDKPLADKTAKALGQASKAYAVDVTNPESIEAAVKATLTDFKRIDILVNNAGIAGGNAPTWELPIADWQRVIRINLDGPFYCCRAVVPTMIAQKYGRIINIASIAGKEGNPMASHYSAAKAGVIGLTKSLGKELGVFTDPYQWYGRLSDEMLRAMRLVVDTGLHSKGWTREQAIKYMLDNSSMAESDVTAEVERYIVWPGQALGYKLGQLHISALRARAQSQLGNRFDVRDFHSQILRDGSVPMNVLTDKIDRWIASRQRAVK